MKREIKKPEDLRMQADYNRLGRVEQIIIDAIINNKDVVPIQDHLMSDFVLKKLKSSGYVVEVIKEDVFFPDVHFPKDIFIIIL